MNLVQDLDRVGVVPLPLGNRVLEPLVVTLARERQHPARHRDRHPDGGAGRGPLTHEQEGYFPGRFAWDR